MLYVESISQAKYYSVKTNTPNNLVHVSTNRKRNLSLNDPLYNMVLWVKLNASNAFRTVQVDMKGAN